MSGESFNPVHLEDPTLGLDSTLISILAHRAPDDVIFHPDRYDDCDARCQRIISWYKRNISHVYLSRELIDAVATSIGGRTCLEVGAGTGILAHLLAQQHCRITATEPFDIQTTSTVVATIQAPMRLDAKTAVQTIITKVLLICCPLPAVPEGASADDYVSYASEALLWTAAETVIFVGEPDPEYMGCDMFYEMLRGPLWVLVSVEEVPSYSFEKLSVYRYDRARRDTPA
jgi:hypothetical protein